MQGGRFRGLVWLLFSSMAAAQPVSFGAAGGVPVSPRSENHGEGCFDRGPPVCGPNDFFAKPYAAGATIAVQLPWAFSAESGFLYERFHKDLAQGLTVGRGSNTVNFGEKYSVAADGWLFPFLLGRTFGRRRMAPFIKAGATLRHLGAFAGRGIELDFNLQPQPVNVHIASGRDLDAAITAGAGLRCRVGALDVAPEIRFLHWTSGYYQPAQNEAMLMVGVSFPARAAP